MDKDVKPRPISSVTHSNKAENILQDPADICSFTVNTHEHKYVVMEQTGSSSIVSSCSLATFPCYDLIRCCVVVPQTPSICRRLDTIIAALELATNCGERRGDNQLPLPLHRRTCRVLLLNLKLGMCHAYRESEGGGNANVMAIQRHPVDTAGRGSKMEAENRAARGRFSMGNLDC